jgi:hypothetical protein
LFIFQIKKLGTLFSDLPSQRMEREVANMHDGVAEEKVRFYPRKPPDYKL